MEVSGFVDRFAVLGPEWQDADQVYAELAKPGFADLFPLSLEALEFWKSENPEGGTPAAYFYVSLSDELETLASRELEELGGSFANGLAQVLADPAGLQAVSLRDEFIELDRKWGERPVWETIKIYSPTITDGYLLNAVDMKKGIDCPVARDESERIYITIFIRTMIMSMTITFLCLILAYPVAYFIAHQPLRKANLYLILVLLPFWTSLLVRTSAWKVLLQQEGVINDFLVALHILDDSGRLIMINNQFGTIIAMTHILLPFMILPLYSVMKTIPPSYVRAAKSLGANSWTAFPPGVFSADHGRNRGWVRARVHPCDWLLHHTGTCRWHQGNLHLEPDCLSHFEFTQLGTRGSACDNALRSGSHSLLCL